MMNGLKFLAYHSQKWKIIMDLVDGTAFRKTLITANTNSSHFYNTKKLVYPWKSVILILKCLDHLIVHTPTTACELKLSGLENCEIC